MSPASYDAHLGKPRPSRRWPGRPRRRADGGEASKSPRGGTGGNRSSHVARESSRRLRTSRAAFGIGAGASSGRRPGVRRRPCRSGARCAARRRRAGPGRRTRPLGGAMPDLHDDLGRPPPRSARRRAARGPTAAARCGSSRRPTASCAWWRRSSRPPRRSPRGHGRRRPRRVRAEERAVARQELGVGDRASVSSTRRMTPRSRRCAWMTSASGRPMCPRPRRVHGGHPLVDEQEAQVLVEQAQPDGRGSRGSCRAARGWTPPRRRAGRAHTHCAQRSASSSATGTSDSFVTRARAWSSRKVSRRCSLRRRPSSGR
jgi:hypothetical protein